MWVTGVFANQQLLERYQPGRDLKQSGHSVPALFLSLKAGKTFIRHHATVLSSSFFHSLTAVEVWICRPRKLVFIFFHYGKQQSRPGL